MSDIHEEIRRLLVELYGQETAEKTHAQLVRMIEGYRPSLPPPRPLSFSQKDAVLITYADIVQSPGRPPLAVLSDFLREHLGASIPTVHLLPFFPYSSDDGFSVIDYKAVDPNNGDWGDIARLAAHYNLMFDAVINHISAKSSWFQGFLQGDPTYEQYFITVEPGTDLSQVFRPRALPLLTPFNTPGGEKLVWTTFSEDQVDLNFQNPRLLLEVINVLLYYVQKGSLYIRLDAIAFLWKEPGTPSVHLRQTHAVIQLFRLILDDVAPQTVLVTETNVPHRDNISYFGDGMNEAQMVYNFSLPPLVLHAIHRGDASVLTRWAHSLDTPSNRTTFFNFLASHDGIGVTPAQGLLSPAEIEALGERVNALGGHVSYRNNPDGTRSPYELNINYLDALGDPARPDEMPEFKARRFLLSQAIMLALRGVPGIYFHSLFGSRGWPEGVEETGRARTINRQKLALEQIEGELKEAQSLRGLVFYPYRALLDIRRRARRTAFSPIGEQEVLQLGEQVFAVRRSSPDGRDQVLCLNNVSGRTVRVWVESSSIGGTSRRGLADLVSGKPVLPGPDGGIELTLDAYQTMWLAERD